MIITITVKEITLTQLKDKMKANMVTGIRFNYHGEYCEATVDPYGIYNIYRENVDIGFGYVHLSLDKMLYVVDRAEIISVDTIKQ